MGHFTGLDGGNSEEGLTGADPIRACGQQRSGDAFSCASDDPAAVAAFARDSFRAAVGAVRVTLRR